MVFSRRTLSIVYAVGSLSGARGGIYMRVRARQAEDEPGGRVRPELRDRDSHSRLCRRGTA
jgi:hypothetical protein